MKQIILIASVGQNNELGYNNNLIWHLPGDLKFFQKTTTGHQIIMGRKTFESLPHPLANRTHLVITHQDILNPEIKNFHSKEEIDAYLNNLDEEVFVIGGSLIYQMFIKEAEKIFLTEINDTKKSRCIFPLF